MTCDDFTVKKFEEIEAVQGATNILIKTGYIRLLVYNRIKIFWIHSRIKLVNPNSQALVLRFTGDGAAHSTSNNYAEQYGILDYVAFDPNNSYLYDLMVHSTGISITKNSTTVSGNTIGTNENDLRGSIIYLK